MSVFSKIINLSTKGFCDVQNVTAQAQAAVTEAKINEGLTCIWVKGSTAAVTVIEDEPNLVQDFCEFMEKLLPRDMETRHGRTWGDDNGFSHLRASLIGPSVTVPISKGKLTLGKWQEIVVCDFDNRTREREVVIQIVGENT